MVMNLINKHEDNSGLTDPTAYQKDLFVRQLGRSNVSVRSNDSHSCLF